MWVDAHQPKGVTPKHWITVTGAVWFIRKEDLGQMKRYALAKEWSGTQRFHSSFDGCPGIATFSHSRGKCH